MFSYNYSLIHHQDVEKAITTFHHKAKWTHLVELCFISTHKKKKKIV